MLESRYAFPWQAAGWEEQAAPSESIDGSVVEPCQKVVDIAFAHSVGRQSQHDLLASVGRSRAVPVAIAYEVMPDVIERLCLAEGQARVIGSRE
jgi:hypothetical protein